MTPTLTVQRAPMASALGIDLHPGDRVGSLDTWTLRVVETVVPGECGDRAGALRGTCRCAMPTLADPTRMPRRVVLDTRGQRHTLFDHVRYAVAARPVGTPR